MSLRISSALFFAAIAAGCTTESPAPEGDLIDCAIGPGAEFSKVCTLEVVGDGEFLLHSPDGSFRRLVWSEAEGLRTADGAESIDYERQSFEHLVGKDAPPLILEFAIGSDRYRFNTAALVLHAND